MQTPFEDLSLQGRFDRLDRAQAHLDWQAINTPAGGVILHLRARAKATRRTARLFLVMLVLTILTGLAFYLGLPFWQTWADGRQEALVETLAGIDARKAELDRDRKALLLGGELTKGGKVTGLPDLLRDAFVDIPTGRAAILRGTATLGDRLYVFGDGGTVLRLATDRTGFEEVPTNTLANLLGAIVHGDRLYVFGDGGTVLRLSEDGTGFDNLLTDTHTNLSGAIVHGNRLYVFGDGGTVLRLVVDGGWFHVVPTGSPATIRDAIIYDDRLLIVGESGTVLRLTAAGTRFEEVPTEMQVDFWGATVHRDLLYVFGKNGTVHRLRADGVGFKEVPVGRQVFLLGTISYDDRLYVFGESGDVFRLSLDGARFLKVPNSTSVTAKGAVVYRDRLFVFCEYGTLLRLSPDGEMFEDIPTGTTISLVDAVILGDRLFLVGSQHQVLATTGAFAATATALPVGSDETSRAAVETFLDNVLPPYLRIWEPVQNLRDDLRLINSEQAGLEVVEAKARKHLNQLDESPLQYLRDRRALDFKGFLDGCRGGATANADITTACLTAWQSDQTAAQRSWWETLADQLPPGILLLFLLATLGGLYRYNLRLAGFHESRADALQLLAQGRDVTQLRDILAATPGEAVNLATLFLAADKVEMGTIRAKLGQAEIELAKALNSSE